MSTVVIDLSDAEDVKLVRVNKKRLNGAFMPVATRDEQWPLIDKLIDLSKSAQRVFRDILRECSGDNRVVYWSTELNQREELCELVNADLIARPTAAQHPRRKGYTTVLVNPHLVLTTDDVAHNLWVITQSARTQP